MDPYLLLRVLRYGPLGCIRYIESEVHKGFPLKGPMIRTMRVVFGLRACRTCRADRAHAAFLL